MSDDAVEAFKALARTHAGLALRTLVDVMGDPYAKEAARVLASKIVLERAFGMPERKTEVEISATIYDERIAHLDALKMLAVGSTSDRKRLNKPDYRVIDGEFSEIAASRVAREKSPYEE